MGNIKLRPYQEECLETILHKFNQGVSRQLVHLPTAAGANLLKKACFFA